MTAAPWPRWYAPAVGTVPDVAGLPRTAIVHADGRLYLERFHLVDTAPCQVRIHHWLASDDDRAPHDHPWPNTTLVLAGHLVEHGPNGPIDLTPGAVVVRPAADPHRIELVTADAWTVFVTGPIVRDWGFHTDHGWVGWRKWPNAGHYEQTGLA